jgi:CheY-like chemotaxis protein
MPLIPLGVRVRTRSRENLQGLVADDDDGSRFVLTRALEDIGFTVVAVDDGASVAHLIAQQHFDLLVIDLYMSGMNGFEVLRQIRRPPAGFLPRSRTPRAVPVLVVSAESHPASIANAKKLGADEYLVKPIDVEAFTLAAQKLVNSAAASCGWHEA